MRGNFYRFTKISDNTWQGYGPGRVVTFMGKDAKIMDKWDKYVIKFNKTHPESPIDRTDYFNFMIEELW